MSSSERPRRLVMGPFNRVEGDLEVRLELADGAVRRAWVNSPMYRGFEQILVGRDPMDALVYVPRICGICSVSQSLAAADALARLSGIRMPANGRHVLNLMAGAENAADHLTHFYLFFMPDFARPVYRAAAWYPAVFERFAAGNGVGARQAIAARARWLAIVGTLGGKWPHTQSVQPGGSARAVDRSEQLRLIAKIREFRRFLEQTVIGDELEAVLALDSAAALQAWRERAPGRGDLRLFLDIADALALHTLGKGPGRLLSLGAYPDDVEGHALRPGHFDGKTSAVRLDAIVEDVSHARYAADAAVSPSQGRTEPDIDKAGAYSWCKAPRYDGRVVETGALARAVVAGQAALRDDFGQHGANVRNRVVARLLELARITVLAEQWARAIEPGDPFFALGRHGLPDGQAVGVHEAARGALSHWIAVENGRLARYQIIAPTTWNFSPRDADGVPGALEAALVGAPVQDGEDMPVAVQHIVRSFDPCMVCTVH